MYIGPDTLRLTPGDVCVIGAQVSAHVSVFQGRGSKKMRQDTMFRLQQLRNFRMNCAAGLANAKRDFWFFEMQRQIGVASHKMARQQGWHLP